MTAKHLGVLACALAAASLEPSGLLADEPEAVDPPEDPVVVKVTGATSVWGLNQHGFLLGKDHPLDDASYVVQNFRLGMTASNSKVGATLRLDAAQGWWGVDNNPDVELSETTDADGNVVPTTVSNPYALFRDKDTNYPVHVDQAFMHFNVPRAPVRIEIGRQYQTVGNKLVLDYDYDGIDVTVGPFSGVKITGLWAKVSEGLGSYLNPTGALMSDDDNGADADLFGGMVNFANETLKAEVFGLHYRDGIPDYDYLPQGLGYGYARFQPQLTTATAVGAAVNATLPVAAGLKLDVEVDYLVGTDEVDNTDYAGNLLDINDGTLRGYNAYVKATQAIAAGVPLEVGVLFGLGSGDDDPTSGPGNINRIQTMGFFPLTNVWEDSVMPDIEGISPQGLGSPVSRGYREFENTTALQARFGVTPVKPLTIDLSYTYLKATEPIHGWNAAGPTTQTSDDLGMEVDANLTVRIWKELTYKALFGYFIPGEGAGLLINGNTDVLESAWELKQVLMFKF